MFNTYMSTSTLKASRDPAGWPQRPAHSTPRCCAIPEMKMMHDGQ